MDPNSAMYASNAHLVLPPDRSGRRGEAGDQRSGEPVSLAGRVNPRSMGDRAGRSLEGEEKRKATENVKRKRET